MSGHSSSSTFHHFQEFIIFNYQNIRSSKNQIFKFRNFKSSNFEISKIKKSGTQDVRTFWPDSQISKIHIFQGCSSTFSCIFEVNSWEIRGSRVHYGSKTSRFLRSSKIHPKSIGIDQESIISHLGIIKTPQTPVKL